MCLGSTDIPLGEAGIAQAEGMAAVLPPVTAVFSSPLSRAVRTAEAIGMPVTVLEDLREMHMGIWDGLTFTRIRSRYPQLYEARGKDPSLLPPEAEEPEMALRRFQGAMTALAAAAPGDAAVVAHGGIIEKFLGSIGACPRKPGYAEIIPLIWDKDQFNLQEEP